MLDEEAKATQEVARFGTKALDSGDKLGSFLSKVFGTVPSDVVGVLGGDWLHHVRIRNAVKLAQRTEEILRERGISPEPMSPSVAMPILKAGQDETREELRELWARLLANGMDPERRSLIRQSIIEAVKGFDPPDAIMLRKWYELSQEESDTLQVFRTLYDILKVSDDQFNLSVRNLVRLECIEAFGPQNAYSRFAPLGREVIRATSL